jgi:hypothetical protein
MTPLDGEATTLADLPPELLTALLQHAEVEGVLSARLAARFLRGPGAAAVLELLADGAALPLDAWRAFPHATRLRVDHASVPRPELVQRLLLLVQSLPSRVQAIAMALDCHARQDIRAASKQSTPSQHEQQLVQALITAPCSPGLAQLHIAPLCVSTAPADALLLGLPSLRSAQLSVCWGAAQAGTARAAVEQALAARMAAPDTPVAAVPAATWRPQAGHLQHLSRCAAGSSSEGAPLGPSCPLAVLVPAAADSSQRLPTCPCSLTICCTDSSMYLDLSALGGATRLQRLCLAGSVHNWQVVGSLTSLQYIEVLRFARLYIPLPPRHLAGLQQLRNVSMVYDNCGAEDWRALAQLPLLEEVTFGDVVVPQDAAPAAVTSLTCIAGELLLEVPAAALEGCLGRLLPRLEMLSVGGVGDPGQLLRALKGHAALDDLCIFIWEGDYAGPEGWAPQQLSQLPTLLMLKLDVDLISVDALLEDVAGSSSVRSIDVSFRSDGAGGQQRGQGLAALAAGACSDCLQQLRVVSEARQGLPEEEGFAATALFDVEQVAGLLGGGMRELQHVELDVLVPRSLRSPGAQVLRRLPALLRQQGRWQCSCMRKPGHDAQGRWYVPVLLQLG